MRARKTAIATGILGGTLAAAGMPAFAIDLGDEPPPLAQPYVRDRSLTFHLRTYYLDRDKPAPSSDLNASTAGGWIGYDSGYFFDRLKIGLTGYTSQKLDGPADQDGTLLLKPGQQSYGSLGESYAKVKLWDTHAFSAYRQLVNQPEVNPQDNRMTPNTFEAYNFTGKVEGLEYFAGYVDKMKARNSTVFVDMATIAGASGGKEGMALGGLSYAPTKDLKLRLSSYHVPDILNSTFTDVEWGPMISERWQLRLGAEYMFQGSTGSDRLTGSNFSTWAGGLRAALWGTRGGTLRIAYTRTGSGANYRSPYGTWAGYTSDVVTDFNRAGERAFHLEGSYDFKALQVPGLVFTAYGTFGGKAIDPATGARVSDKNEYNATLDYRFNGDQWPDWLKTLWPRARVTRVDESFNGATTHTWDYRFIVNYEYVLKY